MRSSLLLSWFLLLAFPILALAEAPGAGPSFQLGFAALAGQIPDVAGQPLEDEHHGDNGDGLQQTTTGLMVWRKADNWTAFTNGTWTWVNGPDGVQDRSNADRFPWEADDRGLAPAPASSSPELLLFRSPSAPSGQAMPVGDIPGWRQIFAEDFTTSVPVGSFPGSVYSAKWGVYQDGWKDTTKNGTYMPSKVLSVQNGMLDYYIHTENGVHMVAAPLPKVPGTKASGQTYGRYEIRFRSDKLRGYKTAFLLWPDSEKWPNDGEIDFPEGDLDGKISAFAHFARSSGGQNVFDTSATYDSWHTSTIEWSPGKVTFYLDGKAIGTSTTSVPSNPMHWVLQAETTLNRIIPDNATAGHVQVDWVVAYAPK